MLAKSIRTLRTVLIVFSVCLMTLAPGRASALSNQLLLLLPDNFTLPDPRVSAWLDSAAEEGLQIALISDTQFKQGGTSLQQYQGLILPDQVHTIADDTLVSAIQTYALNGGRVMLVYDFGVLNAAGFYPAGQSRFSSMAGVNYVLYDTLGGNMIGLGSVTGMGSTLRALQIPPGKSMTWPGTTAAATASATTLSSTSTGSTTNPPLYLQPSTSNPGGLAGYNHQAYFTYKTVNGRMTGVPLNLGRVSTGARVGSGSYWPSSTRPSSASTSMSMSGATSFASTSPAATTDVLEGISGYVYGFLTYPSYVTQGTYTGTTLLTSPNFGLVAGYQAYGNGGVMFVNLPLAYLDGQTDSMPIHGFLRYFTTNVLSMPRLSLQPRAQAGMVLNWHFCAEDQIQPAQYLKNYGIWNNGPYSIVMTAGPDDVTIGDGLGINLTNNTQAKQLVAFLLKRGHNVGSHGGWAHDYWGANASETNASTFTQYLVLNRNAVQSVTGKPDIEWAAPEGNTPTWAVNWLESNGYSGYYFTGHTGNAQTRAYRNGSLLNPGIWAFPVMPFGKYATFEEFQEFAVPTADVQNWYLSLMDFVVANHTSRLIYMHPLGASWYPNVVTTILSRAASLAKTGQFKWFTMDQLTQFDRRRLLVNWTATDTGTGWTFSATHPSSLQDMTWLLPKSTYQMPSVKSGSATIVSTDPVNWLVIAGTGKSLSFTSTKAH
ncbi:polysaccharide deacetylase family protein [Burkholderia cenocepacia]|uniref:polysaccharide deacetylase family protein n=1 Tax=Burkholderia cenocepacia TaxID=95486 RepID=UPI00222FFC89|nr:polysaccharide deacetylase family protein [Burkholderia cenocepacia]MCW3505415.1 polysaccharide deacetylase family protein [Burkholderia cenocepacia]MCW3512993.1 polysaccharide deacetylase family protein [Burkholderia cenocepacia]MCW3520564.1 polysaccharide deacetylase family protein [Burkholderia cenocepacia]MCW3535817.1 polysaccharide deacetylase family protein [Burkholderia cenocepacia]MCW3550919.1 polysaccharide deacetylase family protein [Burkholderia cenocepacia]